MYLVTAFWWEEAGKKQEKIRAERNQMVTSLSQNPKYVTDSNLSYRDLMKQKNNNTKRKNIVCFPNNVFT